MRDLNFFEPYIEKRDIKFSKGLVLSLMGVFLLTLFTSYSIINYVRINKMKAEIKDLRLIAENPKIVHRVEIIKVQEDEVDLFKLEVERIRDLNKNIKDTDFIKEDFLKSVTGKMPKGMFLNSYRVSPREIAISGVSQDKLSVAEFRKGLEKIDKVADIFITNITRNEDYYNFNLTCMLEEVDLKNE